MANTLLPLASSDADALHSPSALISPREFVMRRSGTFFVIRANYNYLCGLYLLNMYILHTQVTIFEFISFAVHMYNELNKLNLLARSYTSQVKLWSKLVILTSRAELACYLNEH